MRGLLTGSFDPITLGHLDIIRVASKLCDELIVCMFINENKDYFFTKEERLNLLRLATQEFVNVKIDCSEGMVYSYCIDNKIDVIYRGFRNSTDYNYEVEMGKYNHNHCGIITKLIPSVESFINISSSKIKEMIENNENWEKLAPKEIVKDIKYYIGIKGF